MFFIACFLLIIAFGKLISSVIALLQTQSFVSRPTELLKVKSTKQLLILVPVLREQRVIIPTLEHFAQMENAGSSTMLLVCGTAREEQIPGIPSTRSTVESWLARNPQVFMTICYHEAQDHGGDRATQLNSGVRFAIAQGFSADIIGVYDADSRPDPHTLQEVVALFESGADCVQQPVNFVKASSQLAKNKVSPVMVANAINQTSWSAIREIPRWYHNARQCNILSYWRNIYLIGHGQFISRRIHEQFSFPEHEVTDGIQLGYRLGMSGIRIHLARSWCVDDVPVDVRQLIGQHKRWFGGCMRLRSAWLARQPGSGPAGFMQLVDGFWSQLSWAFGPLFSLGLLICIPFMSAATGSPWFAIATIATLAGHTYIVPLLSHRALGLVLKVRPVDWLALPVAMTVKSIGPLLYFLENLRRFITPGYIVRYRKVER